MGIVVDRLQALLRGVFGAIVAAAQMSSAAALVAATALAAWASTVGDGDFPVVDVFLDKGIWAALDSGRNTTYHGEVWAQNA